MQTQDKNLVLNVLANNEQPEEKKKVIYAYASSEDAISSHSNSKEELIPQSVPVTHILFQLFALKQVDSMIFMHEPGNPNSGIEVKRSDLVNLIQEELQQLSNTPPNLA